jgi:hypothetical protein
MTTQLWNPITLRNLEDGGDMKNDVFWDVTPCGLVRTDLSEELSASFIRVTRIGQLGTTLAVTSNDARCEEILSEVFATSSQRASVASYS